MELFSTNGWNAKALEFVFFVVANFNMCPRFLAASEPVLMLKVYPWCLGPKVLRFSLI